MSSEANNDAAESPSAHVPEGTSPVSDAETSTPEHALPSVIVDPSAAEAPVPTQDASLVIEPSVSEPSSEATAIAAQPPQSESPDADDGGAWSVGALSEHEADHFADSLRPSWDVSAMEMEPGWSAAASPAAVVAVPTTRTRAPSAESDGLPPIVLAKRLDRRVLVAGASVLLVIVLVIWSMSGGEPEAPPSWNKAPTSTAPAQAVKPTNAAPAPAAQAPAAAITQAPANMPVTPVENPPVAPSPVVTTTPAATTDTATTSAKSVHVRISTVPASADLKLDGDAVPNPFDAWMARGGSHTIVATAEGYVEHEWSVAFDQDQILSLALKREEVRRPAARRARRVAAKKPAATSGGRPHGAGFVVDNPY